MFTRVAHVLSVSLWFGSVAFFTAAGLLIFGAFEEVVRSEERPAWLPAVPLYDKMPLEQGSRAAGVAVGGIFPFYFALQAGCAAVALLTALRLGGRVRRTACVVGLALVLAGWGLERVVHDLRGPRNAKTDAALAEPGEGREAEMRAARAAFGMWHGVSLLANFGTLAVSGTLAGLLAALPSPVGRAESSKPDGRSADRHAPP